MPVLPAVSAICPTYARPRLLEESIYSFLQQDYAGKKELIVLNDYDQQTLVFEHPEVKVFNVKQRYPSLGEKRNMAISLASYDILMLWDDDDICLPHRISLSVERLRSSKGYFKQGPRVAVLDAAEVMRFHESAFHGTGAFLKELYLEAGRYPPMGAGEDYALETAFGRIISPENFVTLSDPREFYYLYRWGGTNSYHASWYEDTQTNNLVANYAREALLKGEIPQGIIPLCPCWHADYAAKHRVFIESIISS